MISAEQRAQIRRLFHAEHWKIGTIAAELGVHADTVRTALETERFRRSPAPRAALTDPYLDFIQQTLEQHPRLRATRLYQMLRDRGYAGSVVQLRRVVATLRPPRQEAFLRLTTLPGEQGQADWASFGTVTIGRAQRRLSCFVLTLSYSRALYLEFFFDQTIENFLLGHVHAFNEWGGAPRTILLEYVPGNIFELMCPTALCAGGPRTWCLLSLLVSGGNIITKGISAKPRGFHHPSKLLFGGTPPKCPKEAHKHAVLLPSVGL